MRNFEIVKPSLIAFFIAAFLPGCGVRGKPQPPLTPTELGRGRPTFKHASEEFAFPNVPSPDAKPQPTPAPTPGSF